MGYECHILWDDSYTEFAEGHFKCEGEHTVIHNLPYIKQYGSKHKRGVFDDVTPVETETQEALKTIRNELEKVKSEATKDIFLWMHLPHVLRGRQGYGSDIDVFDEIIGMAREIYGDDDIFISADHGHMNGWKNKYHYGYDVENEAICVPMIAPKLQGETEINYPTSTIQLYDILLKRTVPQLEYVISETAYYAQPKRKIAIIKGKYKYCYSKEDKKEYLYDIEFDKEENHNLVCPEFYDVDRFLWYSTAQCFFYPYWKESQQALEELREIKDNLWRTGTFTEEWKNKILHQVKCLYTRYKLSKPNDNIKNIGK